MVFGTWDTQNYQTCNKVYSKRSCTACANFCLKLFNGHIHFSLNNCWWAMRHRLIDVVLKWSNSLYSRTEVEVKLTTQLHLLMMWGMSGTKHILPPYALMTRMGTTLPRAVHYWKKDQHEYYIKLAKKSNLPSIQIKLSI